MQANDRCWRVRKYRQHKHDTMTHDDNTYNGRWQDCRDPQWITAGEYNINPRYRIKPEVCPICKGRCGIYDPEPDIFTPCAACGGTGEEWQWDCLNSNPEQPQH